MTKITVMGTGMVGGALARYLASQDHPVKLYDPPKGLNDKHALRDADIVFVAVPTPFHLDGSGFDDSFLRAALDALPQTEKVVVLKSTMPPGTSDRLQEVYPGHRIMCNPEFLTEATADRDMRHPNRQIIGCGPQNRRAAESVMRLLPDAPFKRIVSAREAEMVKYFCNTLYALKVAFANQMFDLCAALRIDYESVKECAQAEPMVGPNHLEIFHHSFRGYGGKCLPKDTRTMIDIARDHGIDLTLLKAAEAYNNALVADQGFDIRWQEGSPPGRQACERQLRSAAGAIG